MVLYAALVVIGVGRNVEHVFNPIVSFGNLDFPPIVVGVLEAAVPIHAEAEDIPVEAVFGGAIFDDKSGVDHAGADLIGGSVEEVRGGELHEGNMDAFRVAKFEMLDAVGVFRDRANGDVMREEVAPHLFDIGSGEGDLRKEIVGSAAGYLQQLDLLVVVDGVARKNRAHATGSAAGHAENVRVEFARLVEIGGIDAHVRNAGDGRARGLFL